MLSAGGFFSRATFPNVFTFALCVLATFALLVLAMKRVVEMNTVMLRVIFVARDEHRHVRVVHDVICHTSGQRSSEHAFAAAADDDKGHVFVGRQGADGRPRLSSRALYCSVKLRSKTRERLNTDFILVMFIDCCSQ